jgi:hypothetical protein
MERGKKPIQSRLNEMGYGGLIWVKSSALSLLLLRQEANTSLPALSRLLPTDRASKRGAARAQVGKPGAAERRLPFGKRSPLPEPWNSPIGDGPAPSSMNDQGVTPLSSIHGWRRLAKRPWVERLPTRKPLAHKGRPRKVCCPRLGGDRTAPRVGTAKGAGQSSVSVLGMAEGTAMGRRHLLTIPQCALSSCSYAVVLAEWINSK